MMGLKLYQKFRLYILLEIRKNVGLVDVAEHASRLKWRWAVHVSRVNDRRWSERALHRWL